MEEEEIIQEQEPIIIETKGKWQPFEAMTQQTFEVGKTYHIQFGGVCEIMISPDKPQFGIKTSEIDYTKDDINKLWIKTGG